jgi:D-glycero-D-manno-heptose 1,7-bisphosphate phosphatase
MGGGEVVKTIKAIFFDRDGVINDVVVRGATVSSPRTFSEFHVLSEFASFFEQVAPMVAHTFVVSNQPDLSRKLLSLDEHNKINARLKEQFAFREIVYCHHDDSDQCQCRKPKPGMILELLSKYMLSPHECIIIGDRTKDILAGQAAGIKTILYRQSYNASVTCKPDFVVDSFSDVLSLPLNWSK